MVIPGQGFPTEDGHSSSTTTESGSGDSTKQTTATLLSPINVDNVPRANIAHLSPGAIAGIAIASLAVVAFIIFGVISLHIRHSRTLQTLHHRRPSVQTNGIQVENKELGNKYTNTTLIPPRGGEIDYWTSSGRPAPAPALDCKPTSTYYKYKSPTDFQPSTSSSSSPSSNSSNSIPSLTPPWGIDQMHELPTSEPRERGGFNVDWSAYDESLSPPWKVV